MRFIIKYLLTYIQLVHISGITTMPNLGLALLRYILEFSVQWHMLNTDLIQFIRSFRDLMAKYQKAGAFVGACTCLDSLQLDFYHIYKCQLIDTLKIGIQLKMLYLLFSQEHFIPSGFWLSFTLHYWAMLIGFIKYFLINIGLHLLRSLMEHI